MTEEFVIKIKLTKLKEGGYVATSDDLQGLVAEGKTIKETLKIAVEVAEMIIDFNAKNKKTPGLKLNKPKNNLEYPLIINA